VPLIVPRRRPIPEEADLVLGHTPGQHLGSAEEEKRGKRHLATGNQAQGLQQPPVIELAQRGTPTLTAGDRPQAIDFTWIEIVKPHPRYRLGRWVSLPS